VVQERRLIEVLDRFFIRSHQDLITLIGGELPPEFTTADIASVSGWNRRVAQQAAYCLRVCGAIEIVGKKGNALIYQHVSTGARPKKKAALPVKPAVVAKKNSKKATAKKKSTKKRATTKKTATAARKKKSASATAKKKTSKRSSKKAIGKKKTVAKRKTARSKKAGR